MRRAFPFVIVAIVTAGCPPKWTDLKKPDRQPYFVLAKDYTRTEVRGIGNTWVEGLRAGKYVAQAEDADGVYYRGEGACVVRVAGDYAKEYLKTGKNQLPMPFLTGGLYLPRKGVEKDPKLFYIAGGEVDPNVGTVAGQSQGQPANAAQGVGQGIGGAMVGAMIAAGAGEVRSFSYASEKDFLAGLKIVDK